MKPSRYRLTMKARTVLGREVKSLLCDPGSELRLGGREKRRAKLINGMKTRKKNIVLPSICWPWCTNYTAGENKRSGNSAAQTARQQQQQGAAGRQRGLPRAVYTAVGRYQQARCRSAATSSLSISHAAADWSCPHSYSSIKSRPVVTHRTGSINSGVDEHPRETVKLFFQENIRTEAHGTCLLYTSPSPRDRG